MAKTKKTIVRLVLEGNVLAAARKLADELGVNLTTAVRVLLKRGADVTKEKPND
jgi:antitoxin component of RelBE/YafQ-DinJ toxin-antitoxin module